MKKKLLILGLVLLSLTLFVPDGDTSFMGGMFNPVPVPNADIAIEDAGGYYSPDTVESALQQVWARQDTNRTFGRLSKDLLRVSGSDYVSTNYPETVLDGTDEFDAGHGWLTSRSEDGTVDGVGARLRFEIGQNRVVGIGDSILSGQVSDDAARGNWFDMLIDKLPHRGYNYGVPGSTASDWENLVNFALWRRAGYYIVCAGSNDIENDAASAATVQTSLGVIYTAITDAGATPVVCTISIRAAFDAGEIVIAQAVNTWITAQSVANDWPLIDIYGVLTPAGVNVTANFYNDGGAYVHPNYTGSKLVVDSVLPSTFKGYVNLSGFSVAQEWTVHDAAYTSCTAYRILTNTGDDFGLTNTHALGRNHLYYSNDGGGSQQAASFTFPSALGEKTDIVTIELTTPYNWNVTYCGISEIEFYGYSDYFKTLTANTDVHPTNLVLNGDMEAFTGNIPDDWAYADSGMSTSSIENNGASADHEFYGATSCLKMVRTNGTGDWIVSAAMAAIDKDKNYILRLWVKRGDALDLWQFAQYSMYWFKADDAASDISVNHTAFLPFETVNDWELVEIPIWKTGQVLQGSKFIMPSDATQFKMRIYPSWARNAEMFVDNVELFEMP